MKLTPLKITAIVIASVIGLMLLTVIGYVLYVIIQYNRIEDNLALEVGGTTSAQIQTDTQYSIATFNIGFGAYATDFSFFMDSGTMKDGTPVTGKNGKAKNKETVLENTNGAIQTLRTYEQQNGAFDFMFFQEVDTDATRSYHVNQNDMLIQAFGKGTEYTHAVNFHSAWLFYPFNDPHGQSNAGLTTFSRYQIESAVRRSYPLDTGFAKFFDLDRCFSVHRVKLDNGKDFVLINSHMSAYDQGGTIRQQQLAMLNGVLAEEKEKGNYVIVGGDFNHDLLNIDAKLENNEEVPAWYESNQLRPEWVFTLTSEDLADGYSFAAGDNAPTCRSSDMPYVKGQNFTAVLDGFIVSDNIEVVFNYNIGDHDFQYSDHNPAVMSFKLKG